MGMEHLTKQMEENIGMVMGFTIISAALEWLGSKWEETQQEEKELAEKIKQEEEEAEKRRLEGTKVTVESFMAWKAKFDEERLSQKEVVVKEKRLTGKELFLQNISLNESDLQFITEGQEDKVEVDESLFDDLDLDVEEFDDDSEDER